MPAFAHDADILLPSVRARDTTANTPDNLPHDNQGPWFAAVIWVLTGLAAVFLVLRLYCKATRGKKLWWDDYVLVAAFGCLVAQTSLLTYLVHLGFGKHSWDITDWTTYLFIANVTGVCSIVAAAWSKTSFAITLLRFTDGWMRKTVWITIVTVNLFLGLSAVFTYVQCTPVQRLWDFSVPGKCWSPNVIVTYNSFSSAYSGAMDILLAVLPWRIITRRSLNRKERLGLLSAMSMGIFAGVTSIAKTATLSAISNPDTITGVSLMILATAETAITIIATSIPVLRVLIKTSRSHGTPYLSHYSTKKSPALPDRSESRLVATPAPTLEYNGRDKLYATRSNESKWRTQAPPLGNSWLNSASESGLEMSTIRR
ncbi:hypothetical protein GQ53DRAFT_716373 [Thozetella sp. PMI_491]|nr:hypothetical protein GQ53DRAFT_716373 [Thozetella sp. PMI_491]